MRGAHVNPNTNAKGSIMVNTRGSRRLLAISAAALAAVAVAACSAGEGVKYTEVSSALSENCSNCHDSSADARKIVLDGVAALGNGAFSPTNFPATHFPPGLTPTTTADHLNGLPAEHPEAAVLTADMPNELAWILHELYELDALLAEPIPPDYTTQARFDAFATAGNPGAYEGCEVGAKLDLGHAGDPEGMAPLWAPKLIELLVAGGQAAFADFRPITNDERQKLRDYTDQLLPGGLRGCTPGTGSGS